MDTIKRIELIEALKQEMKEYSRKNKETLEHYIVIEFLKNGKTTENAK